MYSLDVNFLKERQAQENFKGNSSKQINFSFNTKTPVIGGLIAMLLFPAIAGGYWWQINNQKTALEEEIKGLETEIQQAQAQNQEIKKLTEEADKVKAETMAIVDVFNQIKPWSAILQDLSNRIPIGVQVDSIQQIPNNIPNANAPTSTTAPTFLLNIRGLARSYNDVNDFLLFLQRSSFFNQNRTQIQSAELIELPLELENSKDLQEEKVTVELPKAIKYSIQTEITGIPSSQLIRELKNAGAEGLVTRLKNLQVNIKQ